MEQTHWTGDRDPPGADSGKATGCRCPSVLPCLTGQIASFWNAPFSTFLYSSASFQGSVHTLKMCRNSGCKDSRLPWGRSTTNQQYLISGQPHTAWKEMSVTITPTKVILESYSLSFWTRQRFSPLSQHISQGDQQVQVDMTSPRALQLCLLVKTEDVLLFPSAKRSSLKDSFLSLLSHCSSKVPAMQKHWK